MGFWRNVLYGRRSSVEEPEFATKENWDSLSNEQRAVLPWNVFGDEDSGTKTTSGARVSEDIALKQSVVYASITLIADGVASLAPMAFTLADDGTKNKQQIPQWIRKPHPEIRRFDVWNQIVVSALAWGNGYARFIRRQSDGIIIGLLPIDPSTMECEWDPNKPGYRRYREGGSRNRWESSYEIFHIQGPTLPGAAKGMSVISYAREAIGLGITLEEYGARYFGQGSQAKVVIEIPNGVNETQAKDIVKTFERFHRGKQNWHRPAIMSGGGKLHQISIPPDDAQFLESRDFQAIEIARWFRVPPHRVGIISKSTSWGSGLAEENMAMLQHTYRPWIQRMQDALTMYAPGGQDIGTIIELDTSDLLKGTFKEQMEVFSTLFEKQIITKNEARRALGYEKVADGDKFLEPEQPQQVADPRTKEDDRKRKQDEAAGRNDKTCPKGQVAVFGKCVPQARSQEIIDEYMSTEEERFNPNHSKSNGEFTHGSGGVGAGPQGTVATGSHLSDLDSKGQAAITKNNERWGISHEDLVSELASKATPEAIERDGPWFHDEAHAFAEDLSGRSGLSMEQVVAITALTSARTPWVQNKKVAERIAMKHQDYAGMDSMVAAKKMGGSLSANMAPAIDVARGVKTPDVAITGIKRRSFFNNIMFPGQTDDVTVDTWMQRSAMQAVAAKGGKMSLEDSLKYLNAGKAATGGAGAGYVSIAEASRHVAASLSAKMGRKVSPDEVQSAYWVAASGHREGLWGKA